MSQQSSKDEIQRLKTALIGNSEVSGIFLNRDPNLGSPGEEIELSLLIFAEIPEQISAINSLLARMDEKPGLPYSIHLWDELEQNDNPGLARSLRDGKLIYWNSLKDLQANQVFKTKLHTLFSFELTRLVQTAKAKFNYQLYGKTGKGLLSTWEGKRIAKSCFLVPYKYKFKVVRFLTAQDVSYKSTEVWMQ